MGCSHANSLMKQLSKQWSVFQEWFESSQGAMEHRLDKFQYKWIKSREVRERMNGETSLSGHHRRRLWAAWERFGLLGIDRGDQSRGEGRRGGGIYGFAFLSLECCLEGNRGKILLLTYFKDIGSMKYYVEYTKHVTMWVTLNSLFWKTSNARPTRCLRR